MKALKALKVIAEHLDLRENLVVTGRPD